MYDDADSAQTIGIVGFVVGGLGVATGVTLLVLSSGSNDSAKTPAIVPYAGTWHRRRYRPVLTPHSHASAVHLSEQQLALALHVEPVAPQLANAQVPPSQRREQHSVLTVQAWPVERHAGHASPFEAVLRATAIRAGAGSARLATRGANDCD